jgi:hypothetical protein
MTQLGRIEKSSQDDEEEEALIYIASCGTP